MRTKLVGLASISILFTCSFLFAQRSEINADVQFIVEWQKNKNIEELAVALALTQDQVDSLVSMKAEVEAIQAEYEPSREATRTSFEATAKEVRDRIEATDTFSEEDKALLKEARKEGKLLGQEIKLRIQAATVALPELLTEEQMATFKEFFPKRNKGNKGQGKGGKDGNRGGKNKLRILLSDAFLSQLTN